MGKCKAKDRSRIDGRNENTSASSLSSISSEIPSPSSSSMGSDISVSTIPAKPLSRRHSDTQLPDSHKKITKKNKRVVRIDDREELTHQTATKYKRTANPPLRNLSKATALISPESRITYSSVLLKFLNGVYQDFIARIQASPVRSSPEVNHYINAIIRQYWAVANNPRGSLEQYAQAIKNFFQEALLNKEVSVLWSQALLQSGQASLYLQPEVISAEPNSLSVREDNKFADATKLDITSSNSLPSSELTLVNDATQFFWHCLKYSTGTIQAEHWVREAERLLQQFQYAVNQFNDQQDRLAGVLKELEEFFIEVDQNGTNLRAIAKMKEDCAWQEACQRAGLPIHTKLSDLSLYKLLTVRNYYLYQQEGLTWRMVLQWIRYFYPKGRDKVIQVIQEERLKKVFRYTCAAAQETFLSFEGLKKKGLDIKRSLANFETTKNQLKNIWGFLEKPGARQMMLRARLSSLSSQNLEAITGELAAWGEHIKHLHDTWCIRLANDLSWIDPGQKVSVFLYGFQSTLEPVLFFLREMILEKAVFGYGIEDHPDRITLLKEFDTALDRILEKFSERFLENSAREELREEMRSVTVRIKRNTEEAAKLQKEAKTQQALQKMEAPKNLSHAHHSQISALDEGGYDSFSSTRALELTTPYSLTHIHETLWRKLKQLSGTNTHGDCEFDPEYPEPLFDVSRFSDNQAYWYVVQELFNRFTVFRKQIAALFEPAADSDEFSSIFLEKINSIQRTLLGWNDLMHQANALANYNEKSPRISLGGAVKSTYFYLKTTQKHVIQPYLAQIDSIYQLLAQLPLLNWEHLKVLNPYYAGHLEKLYMLQRANILTKLVTGVKNGIFPKGNRQIFYNNLSIAQAQTQKLREDIQFVLNHLPKTGFVRDLRETSVQGAVLQEDGLQKCHSVHDLVDYLKTLAIKTHSRQAVAFSSRALGESHWDSLKTVILSKLEEAYQKEKNGKVANFIKVELGEVKKLFALEIPLATKIGRLKKLITYHGIQHDMSLFLLNRQLKPELDLFQDREVFSLVEVIKNKLQQEVTFAEATDLLLKCFSQDSLQDLQGTTTSLQTLQNSIRVLEKLFQGDQAQSLTRHSIFLKLLQLFNEPKQREGWSELISEIDRMILDKKWLDDGADLEQPNAAVGVLPPEKKTTYLSKWLTLFSKKSQAVIEQPMLELESKRSTVPSR